MTLNGTIILPPEQVHGRHLPMQHENMRCFIWGFDYNFTNYNFRK